MEYHIARSNLQLGNGRESVIGYGQDADVDTRIGHGTRLGGRSAYGQRMGRGIRCGTLLGGQRCRPTFGSRHDGSGYADHRHVEIAGLLQSEGYDLPGTGNDAFEVRNDRNLVRLAVEQRHDQHRTLDLDVGEELVLHRTARSVDRLAVGTEHLREGLAAVVADEPVTRSVDLELRRYAVLTLRTGSTRLGDGAHGLSVGTRDAGIGRIVEADGPVPFGIDTDGRGIIAAFAALGQRQHLTVGERDRIDAVLLLDGVDRSAVEQLLERLHVVVEHVDLRFECGQAGAKIVDIAFEIVDIGLLAGDRCQNGHCGKQESKKFFHGI